MPAPSATKNRAAAPRRRYGDVPAVAEYLGVNPRTVRRLMSDGKLTAYRIGDKLLRLDWAEVEALAVRVDPSDVSR